MEMSLKVLAIGNSFSVDSMEFLWDIANSYGMDNVVLGNLYIGGIGLDTHWNNISNNFNDYTYFKNTDGRWLENKNVSVLEGLKDEEWDIVTLQQVSGNSGIKETYSPYLEKLIKYVKEYVLNKKAHLGWNMTWAYQSGSDHLDFGKYHNDQLIMYKAIINTCQTVILNNKDIDIIIPTGTAIQNARGYFGDILNRDGFHLSLDLGRFIAGLMWFKSLTGYSIEKVKFYPKGIPEDKIISIRKAVNNAYAKPFAISK